MSRILYKSSIFCFIYIKKLSYFVKRCLLLVVNYRFMSTFALLITYVNSIRIEDEKMAY